MFILKRNHLNVSYSILYQSVVINTINIFMFCTDLSFYDFQEMVL